MSRRKKDQCNYCKRVLGTGGPMLAPTMDHIKPRAFGGTNHRRNLVKCCFACNSLKGDMTIQEWIVVMQKVPKWWQLATVRGPRGKQLLDALTKREFDLKSKGPGS
jgi:hypothetical protein